MAESLVLVTKSVQGGEKLINGVRAVLINTDDAGSDAQKILEAEAALNRAFPKDAAGADAYPAGYLDTVLEVGNLTSGPIPDDTDAIVFAGTGEVVTTLAP